LAGGILWSLHKTKLEGGGNSISWFDKIGNYLKNKRKYG